ncbi:TonB-dependent receptor [Flexithrix dorotheae]|uniref:TonB-dependent receptor n=1 Tax=Flexithrix dorotheae TaxID=70993 RepID=UPI00047608C1|nr:TonB-dependent receptor [Flexithrix dorotheae]
MRKTTICAIVVFMVSLLAFGFTSLAQSTISGTVKDENTGEPLIGANIVIKGKLVGTTTNLDGQFNLQSSVAPPFTLVFSVVGYSPKEVDVTQDGQNLEVALEEAVVFGQEIVVSASRVEESILESPVSIEKLDIIAIREAPTASFYDALVNLKGVDMSTQSMTFKSIATRGFNSNGNLRMVQLIDGMDNQAPGLNFSVGNIVGISELDLESVELLPGASSALYGPNAINGILLMNSKNPFQYQGLSASVKAGINQPQEGSGAEFKPFYEAGIRYAKAFNDKWAFKVNASYFSAEDWHAQDFRDRTQDGGTRINNPEYDGVNTYGDEAISSSNMKSTAQAMIDAGVLPPGSDALVPDQVVTRTGYEEADLVNYDAESVKLTGALHYRFNDNLEGILQANYGAGTTVYTGLDRYSIANFNLSQIKLELKGSNFFVRGYTTQERAGDAYASGTLGVLMNEAYKPSQQWHPEYVGAYLQAIGAGASNMAAHNAARAFADQGRYEPGTPEFEAAKSRIISTPIPAGAQFLDKTNLYHAEGMYNFSNQIDFMEVIVGANFRMYDLNSEKTLFELDENGEEYNINEYGGYVQLSDRFLNEQLKVSASIRYDKNENFKGQFTPRASAVYTLAQNHNFRASYQTGFRIPTNQDQYINLETPQARLVGGLDLFKQKYNMYNNPVYTPANLEVFGAAFQGALLPSTVRATNEVTQEVMDGTIAPEDAEAEVQRRTIQYSLEASVGELDPVDHKEFKPEKVYSFEFGYKGLIGQKLLIDAYYYSNQYKDYIAANPVVQSAPVEGPSNPLALIGLAGDRQVYSYPVNVDEDIYTFGWAIGLDYSLPKGFTIGGNFSYNKLKDAQKFKDQGLLVQFNTPETKYNISFGNRNLVENLGFNLTYRWQDEFLWESSFASFGTNISTTVPSYSTLDAQLNYKISSIKSIVKIGASNLFNNRYRQAFGNPTAGGMYYVSLVFDQFLN